MLRKVETLGEWGFPYSLIEDREDCVIVDIPETYTRIEPVLEDDVPVVEEVGVDENGNPIYQQVMQEVVYEVDVENVGVEASWEEVRTLWHFDLLIDGVVYSWSGRDGTVKMGIDVDGVLGIVKYRPVVVNGKVGGNVKRVICPRFEPLCVVDGHLQVGGSYSRDATFVGSRTGQLCRLGDVMRIHGEDIYPVWLPEVGDGDEVVME